MAHTPTRQEWEAAYRAAFFETDDSKLFEKINAAEAVICRRVQSLARLPHDAEANALADALIALQILRRERL
jgi:hypothetical protein